MIVRAIVLVLLVAGMPGIAVAVSFGTLPAGAISTNVQSEVVAEICRDHLIDPAHLQAGIPAGYRLIPATEVAKADPRIAGLLARNPDYAGHAVGSLCFMSVGTLVVDGERIHSVGPMPMAFWWVRAAALPEARDARMQGKLEWLQLASWYSRDTVGRERILATDPMAQFVDLEVTQVAPGDWRMRLVLPTESIGAEVRTSGPRIRRGAPEPGFMTVPFTGKSAGTFWVITYFGHHHQAAEGRWRAAGEGAFSEALQIPGEASVFDTFFQDGWSALSGVYGPAR